MASFTAFALIFTQNSYASAWVQNEGRGIVFYNIYLSEFRKYYKTDGNRENQPVFYKSEFKPYIEYGLTDIHTIGFSPSLVAVAADNSTSSLDQNFAIQSFEFTIKNNLYYSSNFAASFENIFEAAGFYSVRETPTFGKKDYFLYTKLNSGYNFSLFEKFTGFIQVGGGVKNRFYDYWGNESGSQLKYDASLGITYGYNQYIIRYDATKSLTGYKTKLNLLDKFGYDTNKLEISAVRNITPKTAFEVGYSFDVAGKNTGSGETVKLSIWRRF